MGRGALPSQKPRACERVGDRTSKNLAFAPRFPRPRRQSDAVRRSECCFCGTGRFSQRENLPYPLASLAPPSVGHLPARLLAVPLQHIPRSFSFFFGARCRQFRHLVPPRFMYPVEPMREPMRILLWYDISYYNEHEAQLEPLSQCGYFVVLENY